MFTGIVEGTGAVVSVEELAGGRRLVVRPPAPWEGTGVGASVAVDGVCLTVAGRPDGLIAFDVVPGTLRVTTVGERRAGDAVNLERAMRLGDRLDGHLVQGHVERTGVVAAVREAGADRVLVVRAADGEPAWVPKGSVTVDGVSLTVATVTRDGFEVCLIPETLRRTTFGGHAAGRRVNLEPDMIGTWVRHWVSAARG